MYCQLYLNKSLFIIVFFLCTMGLVADEAQEIKDFLGSIKTHADIEAKLSKKHVLSYESFFSAKHLTKVAIISEASLEKQEQIFRKEFPDLGNFTKKFDDGFKMLISSIDLNIFKMNYEVKKLASGEFLILFDENDKKKLKIPVILIKDGKQFFFDARMLVTTPNRSSYNRVAEPNIFDIYPVIAVGQYFAFVRELDYSYLIDVYDEFKHVDDNGVKKLLVYLGAYYSGILKITGARLLDKNLNLEIFEKKLIAAQLYYSTHILKEKRIDEIKEAYDIAEEIIKTMSEKEKTIYQIELK